jgi:sulfate adenylyltransferase subunit 1
MEGGIFKVGDEVTILPSGFTSRIKTIQLGGEQLERAFPPMSVTITLEDDLDISRGDMIVRMRNQPEIQQDMDIMVCWMNQKPLTGRAKLVLRHTTKECMAMVQDIQYRVDINTLHRIENISSLQMNDIARISLRTAQPLLIDPYRKNRQTGSVILIDEGSNETMAAGMIV